MGCELARLLGLNEQLLKPVNAAVFKEPARRPARTSFILDKAKKELDYRPHSFLAALRETLR